MKNLHSEAEKLNKMFANCTLQNPVIDWNFSLNALIRSWFLTFALVFKTNNFKKQLFSFATSCLPLAPVSLVNRIL